ncbi:MAG: hypothetical protein Q9191_003452, partial [Dirinaria sp. TL-2023a]
MRNFITCGIGKARTIASAIKSKPPIAKANDGKEGDAVVYRTISEQRVDHIAQLLLKLEDT